MSCKIALVVVHQQCWSLTHIESFSPTMLTRQCGTTLKGFMIILHQLWTIFHMLVPWLSCLCTYMIAAYVHQWHRILLLKCGLGYALWALWLCLIKNFICLVEHEFSNGLFSRSILFSHNVLD